MKNSQIIKDLRLLSTLLPHSWSIICASSSTRPAVSTATSTFPPPLKWQKCKGGFFQCIILSFNHSEECLRVNVNPQFDQRGQVKHHRQVARPKSVLCSLDFDILKSNLQVPIYLSVVRMLVISCSSLSLLLCWVYVALKASVMSRLQWSSLLLCTVTPMVSSSKQRKCA